MAHSLSHALMSEVAIDCGYPASALKERIYVLPRLPGDAIRCGVLDLHRVRRQPGHARRPRRSHAALRAHPQVRPRARAAVFWRSRLRRPRSGSRPSRSHAARRRVPRLPPRLGNQLRGAQRLARPGAARRHSRDRRGRLLLKRGEATLGKACCRHRRAAFTALKRVVEGDHELFGFPTTDANANVAPIHPKAMSVILTTPEEIDAWPHGGCAEGAGVAASGWRRAADRGEGERADGGP